MRVLQIITDSNIGGAGMWVLNAVPAMDMEVEIHVAVPRASLLIPRLKKVISEQQIIEVDHIADTSFSLAGLRALSKVIKSTRPDLVHTHASLAGRIAGIMNGTKVINTRHCVEPVSSGIKRHLKAIVNNRLSHRIIAVSEAIYDNLLESGADKSKTTLLSNGVRPLDFLGRQERVDIRNRYGIDESTVAIGYIGRLEDIKGPLFLPQIAKALNQKTDLPYKMLVAGDGSMKMQLDQAIDMADIGHKVQCLGRIDNIEAFYNSLDILINVSKSEGIPMSLIEGMSLALPLVAFDVGSLHQLIEEGVNGNLIDAFDTSAYADQLIKLMADEKLRIDYGARSRIMMLEQYHVDVMCKKLEKIYREVCL